MGKYKKLIIVNAVVMSVIIPLTVVAILMYDSERNTCVILNKLHIYCVGCGGTRAVISLLHFDLVGALRYNVTAPLAVAVYLYYNVRAFIAIKKDDKAYFKKQKYWLVYVVLAVMILNAVLKNVLLYSGIDIIGDIIK